MTIGWIKHGPNLYRFDATWAVERDWVGRWYVTRDGRAMLEDFDRADLAMDAADSARIMVESAVQIADN